MKLFSALMFEPTSGLWKELMERAEGKVGDKLDLSNSDGSLQKVIFVDDTGDNKTPEAPPSTSGGE